MFPSCSHGNIFFCMKGGKKQGKSKEGLFIEGEVLVLMRSPPNVEEHPLGSPCPSLKRTHSYMGTSLTTLGAILALGGEGGGGGLLSLGCLHA